MPFQAQESRLLDGLRRFFGITGHVGAQLLDDMLPVMDLQNLRPDLLFAVNETRWLVSIQMVAVVAQVNNAYLFNPVGSGKLITVERIGLSSPPSPQKVALDNITATTGVLTTGTMVQRLDSRMGAASNTFQLFLDNNGAAVAGPPYLISGAANSSNTLQLDWVLSPGFGIRIATAAANLQMDVWAFIRERPLSGQGF